MSKKKKIHLFFITDPVYKFKINFIYGGTYEAFHEMIQVETGVKQERESGNTLGCFWFSLTKDLYFLWLPVRYDISTLGHEIIHILFTMFERVGVPIAIQNQETFAYHWAWWFDKVRESIKLANK